MGAITGNPFYFRCVEPCPACGGSGERSPTELSGYPTTCLACSNGVVFLESDAGRERIREATRDWMRRDAQWRFLLKDEVRVVQRMSRGIVLEEAEVDFPPFATWDNRHGQPWQTAIESHVREYRAPVDLLANDGRELKRILREARCEWGSVFTLGHGIKPDYYSADVMNGPREIDYVDADTEAAALYAAAVAAFLPEEK